MDYSDSYSNEANAAIIPEVESQYDNSYEVVNDITENIDSQDVIAPEVVAPSDIDYSNIIPEESNNLEIIDESAEILPAYEEIATENIESEDALNVDDAEMALQQRGYTIENDQSWANIEKGETANRSIEILIVVLILALFATAGLFAYKKFTSPAAPEQEAEDIEGQPLAEGEEQEASQEGKEDEAQEAEQTEEKVEQA